MSFKEQLKKSYNGIKTSAKGFADTVKLEYKKGQLKNELTELYETLGQVRYAELLDDGNATEESAKLCAEIARVSAEIDAISADEPKQNKCKICKKKLPTDITYCPYCGTKVEEI